MNFKHGKYKTPEYQAWLSARARCENPRNKNYDLYGGRGIAMCDRWRGDFRAFFADMGMRPGPKYSLDRINGNGHYEPGNCRWATWPEQRANQRPRSGAGAQGVTRKKNGRWQAQAYAAGRSVYLGSFEHQEQAAAASRIFRASLAA